MVAQDEVLLAREPVADLGVEVKVALIPAEEEIPQVQDRRIPGDHLLPTGDHDLFVLTRAFTVLDDLFVIPVRIRDYVEGWL